MTGRRCLSCLAAALLGGCTGAPSTELFDPPSEGVSTADPPGGAPAGGERADEPPAEPSSAEEPAAPSTSEPEKEGHGLRACAREVEPNDAPELATTFTACLDGQIRTHDVDWTQIIAPPDATQMIVTQSIKGGDIWLRVFSGGASSRAVAGNAASVLPAVGGVTYALVVEAAGDRTSTRHYRLTVAFR